MSARRTPGPAWRRSVFRRFPYKLRRCGSPAASCARPGKTPPAEKRQHSPVRRQSQRSSVAAYTTITTPVSNTSVVNFRIPSAQASTSRHRPGHQAPTPSSASCRRPRQRVPGIKRPSWSGSRHWQSAAHKKPLPAAHPLDEHRYRHVGRRQRAAMLPTVCRPPQDLIQTLGQRPSNSGPAASPTLYAMPLSVTRPGAFSPGQNNSGSHPAAPSWLRLLQPRQHSGESPPGSPAWTGGTASPAAPRRSPAHRVQSPPKAIRKKADSMTVLDF